MSLRRQQVKLAMADSVPMCIWLGKQLLGQSDKQELKQLGSTTLTITEQIITKREDADDPTVPSTSEISG
jgi:hypothetical protein